MVVEELGWVFREQPSQDYGIDAQIEIVDDDEIISGRMFAVQIKSGDSYLREVTRSATEPGWSYWGDADHYAYWLGHCMPVIIVFVDEQRNVFWQTTLGDHIKETEKGFTAWVPEENRLDASAKAVLREHARHWRDVTVRLGDLLETLPPGCHKELNRAGDMDSGAATRLAQLLHEGWAQPELTLATLAAAPPTWLGGSPAAEPLWMAVGAFGLSHNCDESAFEPFLAAAACRQERRGMALALAGLAIVNIDREQAAPYLRQAAEEGAELLAHVGIAALGVPIDDARVLDIPACMLQATDEVLDQQPTVLNFLAEMALRLGDLDAAVSYRERACQVLPQGSAMDLALARTLLRRGRLNSGTASDARRATMLLQGVVEDHRRWHGPSDEALEVLVELHLVSGANEDALMTALPKARGGYAEERELSNSVARMGAVAAVTLGRTEDVSFFEEFLMGSLEGREVEFLRLEADNRPREDRIAVLLALLEDAVDDPMRARAADRLVRLGVWPPAIDDMIGRSILPVEQVEVMRGIFEATDPDGDPEVGVVRLRDLADQTPLAAIALIWVHENAGDLDAAIAECDTLAVRWPDEAGLSVNLVALTWQNGDSDDAISLIRRHAADHRIPQATRLAMCRAAAARLYKASQYDEAIELDRTGLTIGDDPELIWNIIASLHATGRINAALRELRTRKASPTTAAETTLWLELHLGVDLSADEARTLVSLASVELDPRRRTVMHSLIDREIVHRSASQSALDDDLLDEARALLIRNPPDRGGYDPNESSQEAAKGLRDMLSGRGLTPQEVTTWLLEYVQGIRPLHQIADHLGQTYGFALVQRPGAVYAINDLTPGLRAVGNSAARHALDAKSCAVDLSALLTLSFLPDALQARIRARLRPMRLPTATAKDAYTAREQVRDAATRSALLAQHLDGTSSWITLSLADRIRNRDLAQKLLDAVDRTTTEAVGGPHLIADLIALARARALPVWCDDNAARQLLRHTPGIETFSTVELLDELDLTDDQHNEALQRLALVRCVDLPLTGQQVADLISMEAADGDLTNNSAAIIALARPGWWTKRFRSLPNRGEAPGDLMERRARWATDWRLDWPPVALAAARAGANNFNVTFGAALTGIIGTDIDVSRNALDLFVHTLTTCWTSNVGPPASLLVHVQTDASAIVGPDTINAALIRRLGDAGAADAARAAWELLHP